MYKGYIYRHWIVNDKGEEKSYIGQVYNKTPKQRWRNGNGYKPKKGDEPTHFYNAIQLYGWDNFNHKVLFSIECETLDELVFWLDEWEKYYIEKYDSFKHGYNSTTGGRNGIRSEESKQKQRETMRKKYNNGYVSPKKGTNLSNKQKDQIRTTLKEKYASGEIINPMLGKHLSQNAKNKISQVQTGRQRTNEEKQHLSEIFSGEGNPMYGKPCSEERKRKISNARKGQFIGEKHPMYGKKHSEESKKKMREAQKALYEQGYVSPCKDKPRSEETKRKISESKKGSGKGDKNPKARAVICLETLDVFTTVKEASEWCGSGAIGMQIKGQRKTAGKHPETGERLTWMYYDEYLQQEQQNKELDSNNNNKVA